MLYIVKDDLEAGIKPAGTRPYLRDKLPSTVVVHGGSGHVMLPPEWMAYVRSINPINQGFRYMFENNGKDLQKAVGWHNTGKGNRVEQLTFSGNIVSVWKKEGNKAYVITFHLESKPPAEIMLPKSDSLHPIIHLLSTQYKHKLDITTDERYPRTFLIANPGESLWIDMRDLKPYVPKTVPIEISTNNDTNEETMNICDVCGTPLVCPKCVTVTQPEPSKKFELWLDVYQGNDNHDWKLLKANGVDGVVCKAGFGYVNNGGARGSQLDSKYVEFMDGALQAGLKVDSYWWVHPLEDWNRQADTYASRMELYNLKLAILDHEQSYSWQFVIDKKKQKRMWKYERTPSMKISGAGEYIAHQLQSSGFMPMTYTRKDFIDSYAPDMVRWIGKYPMWISGMPKEHCITDNRIEAMLKGFKYCPTWEEWREKYMLDPEGLYQPALPKSISKWDMWQFSMDKVKLPGTGSYADYNWRRI